MSHTDFLNHIARVAEEFLRLAPREVILLHHNDTDGLSSGAILNQALDRASIPVRRYCLELLYPQALEKLLQDPLLSEGTALLVTDFGSGILPELIKYNSLKLPTFVLDHHGIVKAQAPFLRLVNCRDFDISGQMDCSASSICAEFAQSLGRFNSDLLWLGALGAYGDTHLTDEKQFTGINKYVFERALDAGQLKSHSSDVFEDRNGLLAPQYRMALNALGSFGYFDGGPDVALKGLHEGFDQRYLDKAGLLVAKYEAKLSNFLSELQLSHTENLQWFKLDESFSEMGVKTVGLICEHIRDFTSIDDQKYIVGLQKIVPRVPGLGDLDLVGYKISTRLPSLLYQEVMSGKRKPLTETLPAACQHVDGFVDACHPHAAACTIPSDRVNEFIRELTNFSAQQ